MAARINATGHRIVQLYSEITTVLTTAFFPADPANPGRLVGLGSLTDVEAQAYESKLHRLAVKLTCDTMNAARWSGSSAWTEPDVMLALSESDGTTSRQPSDPDTLVRVSWEFNGKPAHAMVPREHAFLIMDSLQQFGIEYRAAHTAQVDEPTPLELALEAMVDALVEDRAQVITQAYYATLGTKN